MEWISVNEKEMPTDGSVFLAMRFSQIVAIRFTKKDDDYPWDAVVLSCYGTPLYKNGFVIDDDAITHWMPLPKPILDAELLDLKGNGDGIS